MFEFIQGRLCKKTQEYCVIQVGGIGFQVYTDIRTSAALGNIGEEVTVYTYLQVKEDGLSLFGFPSQEDLAVFQLLISVNGVGPKMALAILSAMTPSAFSVAVAQGDFKAITAGKGVGPKLAQRIILELKDKVKADLDGTKAPETVLEAEPDLLQEAAAALLVLGYRNAEAVKAVKAAYRDGISLEELVKLSLRKLMK